MVTSLPGDAVAYVEGLPSALSRMQLSAVHRCYVR